MRSRCFDLVKETLAHLGFSVVARLVNRAFGCHMRRYTRWDPGCKARKGVALENRVSGGGEYSHMGPVPPHRFCAPATATGRHIARLRHAVPMGPEDIGQYAWQICLAILDDRILVASADCHLTIVSRAIFCVR